MNLFALPVAVWITVIAIIAATGCIAAVHSWIRISKERKRVKDAESILTGEEAWNDAYPHDIGNLKSWLRTKTIRDDSHLGDFIRTCWSAWLGGRPASLTELHVLVARRERSHKATRLSAGIAALLLVCGIVGTLSAIKPVLGDFRFDPVGGQLTTEQPQTSGADTKAGDADASTDRVNKLIHDLGDAFWPSLVALLGTIFVVSFRGIYSLSLHKFTLDLDRFAVDTLIPRYRVPSLSEQYQEVKATLTSITESLLQREGRFHEAVQQLESFVTGISPALNGLNAAASSTKEATEALASGATSITEALNRNLGEKSSIHRAVKGLDLVFEKTEKCLGVLSSIIEGIGQSNTTSQEKLGSAIQALGQSIDRIGKDHQSRQSEAAKALMDFKESLDDIPAAIQATSEKAVEAGLTAVKASIEELSGEQKRWHSESAKDFMTATTASLAGVTKAGQELVGQAGKVATAATNIQGIKGDVSVALKELTESGKSQISQIGDSTMAKVETAAAILAVEAGKIGTAAERLGKPQREPAPHANPGKWSPTRPDYGNNQEPIEGKVPPPTINPVSTTPEASAVIVPAPTGNQQTEEPPTESAEPPNPSHSPQVAPQQPPLPTVQPTDTITGNGADPSPKGKWWSRILNPFSGKNR